ncbi:MAG: hypothetical protein D6705_13670 [Deltaproteobacteria bacterium]|nr:MAG: hypothetical protein D6705_13670 [Deltaproteobacteria bacterium]
MGRRVVVIAPVVVALASAPVRGAPRSPAGGGTSSAPRLPPATPSPAQSDGTKPDPGAPKDPEQKASAPPNRPADQASSARGPAQAQEGTGRPGEPGSGVVLDRPLHPPDASKLRAPLPVRPRSPAEAAALRDLEVLSIRYGRAAKEFESTVADLMVIGYVQGRRAMHARYKREIDEHAAKARKLRAQAIVRYQRFLELHPDDPTWTPEILFRYAELEFEAANERFIRQEEAYEKALEAYQERLEKDPNAEAPVAPSPEYDKAISLFGQVIERFPNYAFGDAALYMLATLLSEQEDFDKARLAYLALACKNKFTPPDLSEEFPTIKAYEPGDYEGCAPWKEGSKYVAEAWLRIGEMHYDFDELDAAHAAYAIVAADPRGDLYDEALIRLGWTQYLMARFATAAETLDTFVRYADERRKQGDEEGAIQLRDEAVKYIAKIYAEDDWDQDGRPDRVTGLARLDRDYGARKDEPHVPEIYAALGDLYAYQTDYQLAIELWELTLRRWPLAPTAPQIQLKILQAYTMLQDADGAMRARDRLATNYLRGTKWYYANEHDPDVIEAAQKLAEEALVATALDHHQRAQQLKASGDPLAKEEYAIAAKAYAAYLERFPDSESSYQYRFNYAEALFYSDQLQAAAIQYEEVRDSNLDNRLQVDAALGAVAAWEAYVRAEVDAGRLPWPDLPKKGTKGPFEPMDIPEPIQKLQAAYGRYLDIDPDGEDAATFAYLSGEISQRFRHFDEAERRLLLVLEQHCDENVAINAGKVIIDGYVAREDLAKTQEWTEKLMAMGCGEGEEGTKFAGELKSLKHAVRFQEAMMLYEAGQYEAAADRFVALVDEVPDDPQADRALNNAAVAYEKIGRFASASQTYRRIFTDYPDSEFADDALLRSGFNHIRFFEFEKAIELYLVLAEDPRYKDSEYREIALWNAADLADNLQNYDKAAALFRKFAAKTSDQEKAAEAIFRAAETTAKTGKAGPTIKAFRDFLKRYESDPAQVGRALEAHLRIGHTYDALGKRSKAKKAYKRVVDLFAARGLQPATEPADYAAEAQFQLAEYVMNDYLRVKLKSTGKRLERETKKLLDKMVAAAQAYTAVARYKRADWALAATYKTGFAFEQTAIKLREAPVPKSLKPYSEPWFAYQDIVAAAASQFEAKAISFYELTLKQAKEYNIANEWTRAATERLNIYKPEEYPLLREPAVALELEARAP